LKISGVCIYIQEALKFTNISLQKHCKEQDIEITVVRVKLNKKNVITFCVYRAVIIFCVYRAVIIFCVYRAVIIFCVYRAPSGGFDYFLNKLDYILNSLHTYKSEFIICGHINYIGTNNKKKQTDYLLGTYNLTSTVYFPMRTANNSATLIDNIFIDNRRHYTIKPCINGLSGHDAQLVTLNKFSLPFSNIEPSYIRNINKNTIAEFHLQLSWEQWDNMFGNKNVNDIFNNFLNAYLRCYHSSF